MSKLFRNDKQFSIPRIVIAMNIVPCLVLCVCNRRSSRGLTRTLNSRHNHPEGSGGTHFLIEVETSGRQTMNTVPRTHIYEFLRFEGKQHITSGEYLLRSSPRDSILSALRAPHTPTYLFAHLSLPISLSLAPSLSAREEWILAFSLARVRVRAVSSARRV